MTDDARKMLDPTTQQKVVQIISLRSGGFWLVVERINGKLHVGITDGEGPVGWGLDLTMRQARELTEWLVAQMRGPRAGGQA